MKFIVVRIVSYTSQISRALVKVPAAGILSVNSRIQKRESEISIQNLTNHFMFLWASTWRVLLWKWLEQMVSVNTRDHIGPTWLGDRSVWRINLKPTVNCCYLYSYPAWRALRCHSLPSAGGWSSLKTIAISRLRTPICAVPHLIDQHLVCTDTCHWVSTLY